MRALALALLACVFALAADSPFVGTWTMNKSKSKIDPNGPALDSVSTEFMQDGATLKVVITTNGAKAPAVVLDGKEHPVTAPNPAGLAATHYASTVKGKTIQTVFTKDGKTVGTRRTSLSPDGKSFTSVTNGTLPDGKKTSSTVVMEKQ